MHTHIMRMHYLRMHARADLRITQAVGSGGAGAGAKPPPVPRGRGDLRILGVVGSRWRVTAGRQCPGAMRIC